MTCRFLGGLVLISSPSDLPSFYLRLSQNRNDPPPPLLPPRENPGIKYLNHNGVEVSICVGNECISKTSSDTTFPATTSAAVPSPAAAVAVGDGTAPGGTSAASATATSGSPSSSPGEEEGGLAGWAISLIAIIVVAALCCIGFGVVCVLEKRDRKRSFRDEGGGGGGGGCGDDDGGGGDGDDGGASSFSVRDDRSRASFDPFHESRDDRSRASSSRGGNAPTTRHSGASHPSGPARDESSVATRAKDRRDDPSVASSRSKRNPPGLKYPDTPLRMTQEPFAYAEDGDEDYDDAFMGSGLGPITYIEEKGDLGIYFDASIDEPPRKEPTMYVDGFTVSDEAYRGGGGSQKSPGNESSVKSRGGKSFHSIKRETGDASFQASYNSRESESSRNWNGDIHERMTTASVFSQESNASRKSNSKTPSRQRSIYSY